jgi:glycosyltransferase involved in cell wall biosynthesis
MKVALLHYAAPPVVGGVESVIAHQAQLLAQAGHQVKILAGRGQTWDPGVPVETIPLIDSRQDEIIQLKAQLDQGIVPAEFERLTAQIQSELAAALEGIDVLIAHNVASLHKNLALTTALYRLTRRKPDLRLILWHHDLAWHAAGYRNELHPGQPWDLLRTAWPGAVQVTISPARRTELANLFGIPAAQIQVVPAGVDLPAFLKISASTWALIQEHGLDQGMPLLLTPVRLTARKNLQQALRILGALRQTLPQARLVITGPPGAHNPANARYLQDLHTLREELGLGEAACLMADTHPQGLSDEEIVDLYHLADALLLTSREEGFGIPLLEAGLGRLPIFCTGLEPLRNLAGEWAHYFSPDDDPQEVATLISDYLESDPVYQMRAHVRGEYTWQAIYDQKIAPLLEKP